MAMIRDLAPTHTNRQIAEILNTAGHHSACNHPFNPGIINKSAPRPQPARPPTAAGRGDHPDRSRSHSQYQTRIHG
jgi:hypothetical protein